MIALQTKMLLSLNNIAHHIKHSDSPHLANSSSYGALDLSNDEAQHPSQVLLKGKISSFLIKHPKNCE